MISARKPAHARPDRVIEPHRLRRPRPRQFRLNGGWWSTDMPDCGQPCPPLFAKAPRARNRLGLQHMKVWSDGAPITRENSRVRMLLRHCGAAADNPGCGGPLERPWRTGIGRPALPAAHPGPPGVDAHLIPQGLCSGNSPGPGRVLILAGARGLGGDDAPGSFVGAVAGSVHEDLMAGVDEPVQE